MAALIEKFQAMFDLAATPLAKRMTAQSSRASASALKTSLKQLSGGRVNRQPPTAHRMGGALRWKKLPIGSHIDYESRTGRTRDISDAKQ